MQGTCQNCTLRGAPGGARVAPGDQVGVPRRGVRAVPWHPSVLTSRAATHYARRVIAHRLRSIPLLALALLCVPPAAFAAEVHTKPTRTILVLHSFEQGPGWVQNVTAGIEAAFARDDTFSWVLHYEYLNVLDTDPRDFPAIFRLRFSRARFNAVICVDNQALEFVVENRAEFFRSVPIVFCGIDSYEPAMLRGERGITGVIDELDFTGTFALMRLLHPEAKHLLIFANSSIRAEHAAYERLVAAARQEFRQEMTPEFWEDPELPDIRARASSIPDDTIVFTLAYFSDEEGRPYPLAEGTRAVSDALGLPIYSCWESVFGSGIVGGSITRG